MQAPTLTLVYPLISHEPKCLLQNIPILYIAFEIEKSLSNILPSKQRGEGQGAKMRPTAEYKLYSYNIYVGVEDLVGNVYQYTGVNSRYYRTCDHIICVH